VKNIESKTNTPVELIPNMADTDFFKPTFRKEEISAEKPLRILYCGAHGRANQLEFLVMAAQVSQHLPISFTLMGAGSEKARIQQLASGLTNVTFIDHGGKKEVRSQLEKHDAVYLSFQNLPMLHTGCPNKFFDALAAGKIVISNLSGWTADLIQEKEIGFSYSGLEPEEFVNKIQPFLSLDRLSECQNHAHGLSSDYSRTKLSAQFLACLENR
ncbi:MAG: glycosyltransferase, partial [Cyclobacteriaceae bacterium]